MKQRILAFLTAFCMVLALLPAQAFAQTAEPASGYVSGCWQNPLYSHDGCSGVHGHLSAPQTYADGTLSPEDYLTDPQEVYGAIRTGLEQRQATISVPWRISAEGIPSEPEEEQQAALGAKLLEALAQAMIHTGVSTQGDYLQWVYGKAEYGASYSTDGTYYYLAASYEMTYYTTAEQEAELTAALEPVMASFGFTAETDDYTKVKTIYDYICANVTYDYTNLENEAYTLKFTAYAALVNGTAVCQGYATLFYRMLLMAGVDTRVITGTSDGVNHAWNIVKLGDVYYNADSTWDAGKTEYSWLLKSPATFTDHTRSADYDTAEFHADYPMATADYVPGEVHTHEYSTVVTPPTCTEEGFTTYTCTCGHSYTGNKVAATGHSYQNGVCTVCGAEHPNLANYQGKVISILGDSISTFAGYIPTADGFNLEHLARYPQDNLLTDVNETWWMQVINTLDAKLGINDSWRGATVSGAAPVTTGTTGENASMANLVRIQNLGSNGTPDVILFYGGTNDLAHVSNVGAFDAANAPSTVDLTTAKWDNLADGYVHTLLRLRHFYPDAQIVCLLPTYTDSYYSDSKLAQANEVLAAICEHYDVAYTDLRDCGMTTADLPDGIHPDTNGMDYITAAVLTVLQEQCHVLPGAHQVYSVTHHLTNVSASLGHYKGISAGEAFEETLTGEAIEITVTMGGVDITDACYNNGKIRIDAVSDDIVVTAKAAFSLGDRLQQLPELCCGTNLWPLLKHDTDYYTADGWGMHASGNVSSVTIAVQEGDQIRAT